MVRIAGHDYEGYPSFNSGYNRRGIGFVVPADVTPEVIEELKEADHLDVLNRKGEVSATYRLMDWTGLEYVHSGQHSGIALTWNTITLDETDRLKSEISNLKAENESLASENTLLVNALLELADIVGNEETE